jgi:uncharacterized protein YecT (DUF1311 family)
MKKIVLAAALLLGSGSALANSNCDNPRNDFDGLYCLNKVYQEADVELNSIYKQLVAKLDKSGRASLKASQLQWMDKRNLQCSKRENDDFYVNLDCATDMTVRRAQFLQNRLRECNSSGCMNSRLSRIFD